MAWFYMDGNQEKGPIDKTQLQELINGKQVDGNTMVRNESMEQHRPLNELMRKKPAAAKESAPPQPPATAPATPAPTLEKAETPEKAEAPEVVSTVVCGQCHRSFPKGQVVTFDNEVICAACKPMFIQRLKEGVTIAGNFEYAGFWIRFGAKMIDGIILAICQGIIGFCIGMVFALVGVEQEAAVWGIFGIQAFFNLGIPIAYNTYFIGRYSATLGKMACQIKVVTPEGEPVSYARALGRYFGELVSGFMLLIGYIMAAFDDEKRALHDRICSTRVVYK